MRRDIEDKLGLKAHDIYGLTEICGPGVSFECDEQKGMHINEDDFIAKQTRLSWSSGLRTMIRPSRS